MSRSMGVLLLMCGLLIGCDLRKRDQIPNDNGGTPSIGTESLSEGHDSDGDGILDQDELTERKKFIANVPSFDVRIGKFINYTVKNPDSSLIWEHEVDVDLMRQRFEDDTRLENRSILTSLAKLSYRELIEDRIVLTSINHPYFSQFISFQYPNPDMGVPELIRLIEDSVGERESYQVFLNLDLKLLVKGDVFPKGKVEWIDLALFWEDSTKPIFDTKLKTDISLNEEFLLELDQIEVSWRDFLEFTVLQGKIPRIVIKDFKLSGSDKTYKEIIESVSKTSVELLYVDNKTINRSWVSLKKARDFQELLGFATQKQSVFEDGRLVSLGNVQSDYSIITNVLSLTPDSKVVPGSKFIVAQIKKDHVLGSRQLLDKFSYDSDAQPLYSPKGQRIFKNIKADSKVTIGLNLKNFNHFFLKNYWDTSLRLSNGAGVFTCNYAVRDFVVQNKAIWEKQDIDTLLSFMFVNFKTESISVKDLIELGAVTVSFFEGFLQIELDFKGVDLERFGNPASFDLLLKHNQVTSSVGIYSPKAHQGSGAGAFCKNWFSRAVRAKTDICIKSDYSGVIPGCWEACLENNCEQLEPIKKTVGMNPAGKMEIRIYGR